MKPELYKWFEQRIPLVIGSLEVVVGLVLVIFAAIAPRLAIQVSPWLSSLLSDLGVGLLSAGIITGTLEPLSRKRSLNDIQEIKQASYDAILRELMPREIFTEVQEQIIRQPFLRKNSMVVLDIQWLNKKRGFLLIQSTIGYEVKNVSKTLERYLVRVNQERMYENEYPNNVKILKVQIFGQTESDVRTYEGKELEGKTTSDEKFIRVEIPLALEPDETISVKSSGTYIMAASDVFTHVVNRPTVGLDYTVNFPEDLYVEASPLFPSSVSFEPEVQSNISKRWQIKKGLLPFQGIEIIWRPKKKSQKA
jgi:hypothetical protein